MTLRKVVKVGEAFRPFVEEVERRRRPWLFVPNIEKARDKGSGYHRPHRGRPGKIGGSRPRRGGPTIAQRVSAEAFAKNIGVPEGYSWKEGDWAAEYVLQHNIGDPIGVRQKDLLDNVVLGPGRSFGDWAKDVLRQTRPRMLVEESMGVLDARDEILLRNMMPPDVWLVRRTIDVVREEDMPDVDRLSLEREWGISRYAIYPDVKPVGTWDFSGGEFVISINEEAEKKYGLSKRWVAYHELSHTIPGFVVQTVVGKPKKEETVGEYSDRFAATMQRLATQQ